AWETEHGTICPGENWANPGQSFGRIAHRNLATYLAGKGVDLYEFDQMNGGRFEPCYDVNSKHGHPHGYGTWVYARIAGIMQATFNAGRAVNPNFALAMEDPGELFIPVYQADFSRTGKVGLPEWPADVTATSQLVPAFRAVYGDLMPCVTAD